MTGRQPEKSRVFLVEDEALVAMLLEDMLAELGCVPSCTASSLAEGIEQVASVEADIAIIDVNLGGEPSFPIAERLAARGIPVVFSTGYGASDLPPAWRDRPIVAKPFTTEGLRAALAEVFDAPRAADTPA